MAKETEPTPTPAVPTMTPEMFEQMKQFAAIISSGVAAGITATAPKRKVSIGEYDPKTACHPDKKTASRMTREYFQVGHRCEHDTTSDAEIDLLNQITHSGRYINRLVEVVVNSDNVDEVVTINWNCKLPDQRFGVMGFARNFEDMLRQIVTAQKAEDEEDAERELDKATRPRRNHFGKAVQLQGA